jgi:E3 ubiquitin-protein ligase UBR4
MHLLPYLLHMALYVLNTTRAAPRESKALAAYLAASDLLPSCFVPEGPLYWSLVALLLQSHARSVFFWGFCA